MTVTAAPRCAMLGHRYRRNSAVLARFDDVIPRKTNLIVSHATRDVASLYTAQGTVTVTAADLDRCFTQLDEPAGDDELTQAKISLVQHPFVLGEPFIGRPGLILRRTAVPLGSLYDFRIPYGKEVIIDSLKDDMVVMKFPLYPTVTTYQPEVI